MAKRFRLGLLAVCGVLTMAGMSFGEEGGVKLTPTGFASYEIGQIVQADSMTIFTGGGWQTKHLLFQRSFVGMNIKGTYDPLPVSTNIGVVLKSFTETPRKQIVSEDLGLGVRFFYFFFLTQADFVYSPSEAFNLGIGFFPIKYNENARNLGEYLFRSGTYPQYLTTNFDFAGSRVTGLNVYGTLFGGLDYKALLTINTEGATMGDLNLTGIASYSPPNKLINIGAGVSFCSILSANSRHTHPIKSDIQGNRADMYIDDNGDTATYTFAGTKLMAQVSIDPKALFPSEIFGKEDLKLYSEAAILGVKNYPVSIDTSSLGTRYDDIMKRMPIMFGFNFPTFKILDVLSLEAQWFGSKYPNDATEYVLYGIPVPVSTKWSDGNNLIYPDSTRDNWKWSIYAKKTLAGHFNIVFQIASDHMRWDKCSYGDQAYMMSEALTQTRHKYFVMKLGYNF